MKESRQLSVIKHSLLVVLAIIITIPITLIGITFWVGPEGYFFPLPNIDTQFAPGYSEEQFQTIRIGMTKEEVLQRIGPPLNNISHQTWYYSEDGAFRLWDYAWFSVIVGFDSNGQVTDMSSHIRYD